MEIIALFFPAIISVKISLYRTEKKNSDMIQMLMRYGVYVLADNLLTQLIVTYVIGITDVTADALRSFPFFIKYIIITTFIAALLPLGVELTRKYLRVTVEIGVDGEEDRNRNKNN